ncbi:MAG: 1-deoxy-D-xylulose-5-phosphate reductoisomerase [Gemmatimonadetes bacterium]|nr:1-deoxy-D-xylulose-5-phosphate reductoisomerase [Gemmatimonadota bacterium]NNM06307.1 1-deoxy-D-xylulose-5-phosphate reductoisomerase [Gemmatimonadota bacterium]
MIRVAILGSTGSVGRSTLDVIQRHPNRFEVVALAANQAVELLAEQVRKHKPGVAVLSKENGLGRRDDLPPARWSEGREALLEITEAPNVDVVVNAMVGSAGLEPTLRTLKAGKRLALANKESLVAGGRLVVEAAEEGGGELIPVDSEHSAILQCLEGYEMSAVSRLVLTASGGPFRGWSREQLQDVPPSRALNHPTWAMGAKITVDSATLANKALEVIEAHFLYGIDYDSLGVVVHPQSIVHSFVEFVDGSVLAQLGFPTMELPILYAMSYPERVPDGVLQTFDPVKASPLVFEEVDRDTFTLFSLGERAGREGGTSPAVYNAANEVAVEAYLKEDLQFPGMGEIVSEALDRLGGKPVSNLENVLEVDKEAREVSRELIRLLKRKA